MTTEPPLHSQRHLLRTLRILRPSANLQQTGSFFPLHFAHFEQFRLETILAPFWHLQKHGLDSVLNPLAVLQQTGLTSNVQIQGLAGHSPSERTSPLHSHELPAVLTAPSRNLQQTGINTAGHTIGSDGTHTPPFGVSIQILPTTQLTTAQPAFGGNFGIHLAPVGVSTQIVPSMHKVAAQVGLAGPGLDANVKVKRQAERITNLDNILDENLSQNKVFKNGVMGVANRSMDRVERCGVFIANQNS